VLLAVPWAWLAPATAAIGVRRLWVLARPGTRIAAGPTDLALTWLTAATTIAAVASFAIPLTLFWATMRFLGDATAALTLAGTLGWWLWYDRVREQRSARRLIATGAVVFALATAGAGVALGLEGQYKHFRQHNPALLDRLEKTLSFC